MVCWVLCLLQQTHQLQLISISFFKHFLSLQIFQNCGKKKKEHCLYLNEWIPKNNVQDQYPFLMVTWASILQLSKKCCRELLFQVIRTRFKEVGLPQAQQVG